MPAATSPPILSQVSGTVSPTPSHDPNSPKNDSRVLILAVVLGIVAFFVIVGIILYTFRLKRAKSDANGGPYRATIVDRAATAARISPFGSSQAGMGPSFDHTPGSDMRIAVRRPDGAWEFTHPTTPFKPSGVSEIDALPSPSSSTKHLPLGSHTKLSKELEAKNTRREEYQDTVLGRHSVPPPAYVQESEGYLNQART